MDPIPQTPVDTNSLPLSLLAYERACLDRALHESRGNITRAARLLKIGKSTFYRRLHACGIPTPLRRGRLASSA